MENKMKMSVFKWHNYKLFKTFKFFDIAVKKKKNFFLQTIFVLRLKLITIF